MSSVLSTNPVMNVWTDDSFQVFDQLIARNVSAFVPNSDFYVGASSNLTVDVGKDIGVFVACNNGLVSLTGLGGRTYMNVSLNSNFVEIQAGCNMGVKLSSSVTVGVSGMTACNDSKRQVMSSCNVATKGFLFNGGGGVVMSNLVTQDAVYSENIALVYQNPEATRWGEVMEGGYTLRINDNNDLEIVKYAKLVDSNQLGYKNVLQRVALFDPPFNSNMNSDPYLVASGFNPFAKLEQIIRTGRVRFALEGRNGSNILISPSGNITGRVNNQLVGLLQYNLRDFVTDMREQGNVSFQIAQGSLPPNSSLTPQGLLTISLSNAFSQSIVIKATNSFGKSTNIVLPFQVSYLQPPMWTFIGNGSGWSGGNQVTYVQYVGSNGDFYVTSQHSGSLSSNFLRDYSSTSNLGSVRQILNHSENFAVSKYNNSQLVQYCHTNTRTYINQLLPTSNGGFYISGSLTKNVFSFRNMSSPGTSNTTAFTYENMNVNSAGFVFKYGSNGTLLQWARFAQSTGGTASVNSYWMSEDSKKNFYCTCQCLGTSTNYISFVNMSSNATLGTTKFQSSIDNSTYLLKYSSNGTLLSRTVLQSLTDRPFLTNKIIHDNNDNLYIGSTANQTAYFGTPIQVIHLRDFGSNTNLENTRFTLSNVVGVLAKWDSNGVVHSWANVPNIYDITLDNDNGVFIAGNYSATSVLRDMSTTNVNGTSRFTMSNNGGYLCKYNSNGQVIRWARFVGSFNILNLKCTTNHIYLAGVYTGSSAIPIRSLSSTSTEGSVAFSIVPNYSVIIKYNKDGNPLSWMTTKARIYTMDVDMSSNVLIGGNYQSLSSNVLVYGPSTNSNLGSVILTLPQSTDFVSYSVSFNM